MGTSSSARCLAVPPRSLWWATRSLAGVLLASALALVGCESRVSLGASCDVTSDCTYPYVCAAGRCRVECREARDCPFPLECLVVGNASGCRVTEDGACPRGAIDCAEGLDCIEGKCTQPCTDHDQCASAQTCDEAGGCERPPLLPGTCDSLSGAGCDAGQHCTSAGVCETMAVQLALVQNELYGSCDAEHPCRDGLDCRLGRCLRLCRVDGDGQPLTSCGSGSHCKTTDESGSPAPVGLGWCTQPCEVVDPDTCPDGMSCGADFLPASTVQTSCETTITPDCEADPSAVGCVFQPCDGSYRCARGLDCLDTLSDGDVPSFCLAYCDESGACPAGSTCVRRRFAIHYQIGNTSFERGLCLPTCDVTTQLCETPDEQPIACDAAHPVEGSTALCTQACTTNDDCFPSLFVCDTVNGRCTINP